MTLKLFKFLVQPVLLETDDEGNPVGETLGEQVVLYGPEAVRTYLEMLEESLTEAEAARNGRE